MKDTEGCLIGAYNMVKEFHKAFNHPTPDTITKLDDERKKIRASWVIEEVNEFLEAKTIAEEMDAICDAIYFLLGSAVEMNIEPSHIFELIQKANMSKLFPDGKPHYNGQNKVIKPDNWVAPDNAIKEYIDGLIKDEAHKLEILNEE